MPKSFKDHYEMITFFMVHYSKIPVYLFDVKCLKCFNVIDCCRSAENDTILYIAVIAVAVLTFLVGSLLVFMKYRNANANAKGGH